MNKKEILSLIKNKNIPKEYLYYLINYFFYKNDLGEYFNYYKIVIKDIGCNAKCPICEDWKKTGELKKIRINLYKALKEILSEKVQKKQIQILGGEPILIYEDILKVVKICKKYKIKIDFPTNASLLNIEKIDELIESGLDNFTFSIDFPNIKHDKWRNLNGAFDKIITFTKYLKKKKINVQWNTVVGKFNYSDIKDFKSLYEICYPNIHNYICVENHGGSSVNNMISLKDKNNILNILENFELDEKVKINKNGFYEKENKISRCYLILKNKTLFIDENSILYGLCHYEKPIEKLKKFKENALNFGCDKCDSSYKKNFNENFSKFLRHIS